MNFQIINNVDEEGEEKDDVGLMGMIGQSLWDILCQECNLDNI